MIIAVIVTATRSCTITGQTLLTAESMATRFAGVIAKCVHIHQTLHYTSPVTQCHQVYHWYHQTATQSSVCLG